MRDAGEGPSPAAPGPLRFDRHRRPVARSPTGALAGGNCAAGSRHHGAGGCALAGSRSVRRTLLLACAWRNENDRARTARRSQPEENGVMHSRPHRDRRVPCCSLCRSCRLPRARGDRSRRRQAAHGVRGFNPAQDRSRSASRRIPACSPCRARSAGADEAPLQDGSSSDHRRDRARLQQVGASRVRDSLRTGPPDQASADRIPRYRVGTLVVTLQGAPYSATALT